MVNSIDDAFRQAPRRRFLPTDVAASWQLDRPLPIGDRQTNSQPSTVHRMLELLDVRPGMRVLDVGSGSGWTTALLAELVGPHGVVVGVERVPHLVEHARRALGADWPHASIRPAAQGELGCPAEAPFDRILVSAEAARLPESLVDQLGDGGVMVIPVAGTMTRVVRGADETRTTRHGSYVFVPLVED